MDDSTALLVGLAIVVVLIATLMFVMIPEPSQRAIIATDRLDLAVLNFSNSSTWEGVEETVRGRLENALVNKPGIDVFARSQLDSLLAEQLMGESGFVDTTSAVKLGLLTGVSKLVTGSVYGVDTQAEATTICLSWENGACSQQAPGIEYSARILAQVSVINAQTGRIERSLDAMGADTIILPADTAFGGFDTLLASAATDIAATVTSSLADAYTRELRFGLYDDVESKRDGFVGTGESNRFSPSDGDVYLIVHVTRAQSGELFDVSWTDSSGTFEKTVEDVVSENDWRVYSLDTSKLSPGRYHVRGFLNGMGILEIAFTLTP